MIRPLCVQTLRNVLEKNGYEVVGETAEDYGVPGRRTIYVSASLISVTMDITMPNIEWTCTASYEKISGKRILRRRHCRSAHMGQKPQQLKPLNSVAKGFYCQPFQPDHIVKPYKR